MSSDDVQLALPQENTGLFGILQVRDANEQRKEESMLNNKLSKEVADRPELPRTRSSFKPKQRQDQMATPPTLRS
jgi:hypothetical protein